MSLLVALAILAAVHLPPVERAVTRAIEQRAGAALGARLAIGDLDYNLLTRRATVRDLRLSPAAPGALPFFEARQVEVRVPLATLTGAREITSVEIDTPSLRLDALRAWLDTRPARDGAPPSPFFLRRLRVTGLDIVGADQGGTAFALDLRDLALDSTPDGRGFSTPVSGGPGWLRAGAYHTTIRTVSGRLAFDGERLSLAPLQVHAGDVDLRATGTLGLLTPAPAWDLAVEATVDLGLVLANWPAVPATRGRAAATATITGPLAAPLVRVRSTSEQLAVGPTSARRVTGEATVSAATGDVTISDLRADALGGAIALQLRLREAGDEGTLTFARVALRDALAAARVEAPLDGAASGQVQFRGDVATPAAWEATGTLTATPGRGNGVPAAGRADLDLRNGRWRLRLTEGALGDASLGLDARGQLPPAGESPARSTLAGRATVAVSSLARLFDDLGRLGIAIPAAVTTRLDGAVSVNVALDGTVTAPTLRTELAGQPLSVAGLGDVVASGRVALMSARDLQLDQLTLVAGARRLSVSGRLDTHALTADAAIDATGWNVADLRALGLDHASLPATAGLAANGRVVGPLTAPSLDASVEATGVSWYGQTVDRLSGRVATAAASSRAARGAARGRSSVPPGWPGRVVVTGMTAAQGDGRLALDGDWEAAGGGIRVQARATGWHVRPVLLPAAAGPGEAFDVAGLLDLSLEATGTLAAPVGSGRFSLRDGRYGDLHPGAVDGTLSAGGDGTVAVRATAPALAAVVDATARLTTPFAYQANATVSAFDLSRLEELGIVGANVARHVDGTVTARATATGDLRTPSDSTVVVSLDALEGSLYGLPLALESPASLRVSRGDLSSEGIALRTGATRAVARGALGRSDEGRFTLEVTGRASDLLPLLERASGRGAVGDGTVSLSLSAEGRLDAPRLRGRFALRDVNLQLDRFPGLTGVVVAGDLEDGLLTIREGAGRLGGARVSVSGRAPLPLAAGALPAFVVRANPSTGEAALSVAAERLTVAALGRLAGRPPGDDISGEFDVRAEVRASRPSLDAMTGTVWIDGGTVTTNDITVTQMGSAVVEIRDAAASFEEWRWTGGRSDVALRGRVGFGASPVTYEVEARGPVDLAMLGPMFPGRTAGTLRLDVRAASDGDAHGVTGEVVLSGGTWIDRALQVALTDAAGVVRLRGDRALVDALTARLNGGDVLVRGEVRQGSGRQPLAGALTLTGRGVTVEYPRRVVNDVDADLQVIAPGPRGTTIGVTGKALVRPGALRASLLELASLFATAPPVPPTPETERRERVLAGIGLDIAIDTTDDLVADGNELRAQMGAAVRLTGTLAQPGMLGRAEIREGGELFLAGRLYQLRGGHVEFVDASRIDPRLTLLGQTTVSQYEVEMQLTGPVDRLDVRLRSDPPLSQGDLTSLLTTGQTLKERRENTGEASDDLARTQLLSLVSSEYLGLIGRYLGVDTVRIENTTRDLSAIDLDPVARLSVTKSFGSRLELIYSQSLEESDDIAWILRFRPGWRNVEAKATFNTGGGETYELRQELEFGGVSARRRPAGAGRAARPRISEVTITGVPDAEAADLRKRLRLGPGDRFDVFRWQRDRERIERYFRERDRLRTTVSASRRPSAAGDAVALGYDVDRGPVVALRVEGAELGRDTREALRTAWAESSIDQFVAEALEETVRLALAGDGYLQPTVQVRVSPPADDRTEAVVRIDRGPQATARAFAFIGNRAVGEGTLAALIADAGLADRVWVQPETAAGPLVTAYAAAGFLNVRVEPGEPLFSGTRATLPIVIREGRPFTVGEVQVAGTRLVDEADVRQAFGLVEGRPYTPAGIDDGTEAVRLLYARQGHADARVRPESTYDRERSTVRIALDVDEGTRRTVAGVALSGDVTTRPRLTTRALDLPAQGPVDMRQVEEAQRRLYDLGVFRSVEPRFEPAGETTEVAPGALVQPVRVVFDVEEYPDYRLRYGFQVTSGTLSTRELTSTGTRPGVTVDLRRNNLFGLGFDVGGGAFVTVNRSRLRGLVQSSTLGGRPVQTTLSVTRDDTEGESGLLTVQQRRTLLAAEQRWRPTLRTEWAYGYDLEYDDADLTLAVRDGDPLSLTLRARLASANTTLTYDSRDNLLNPTRGMFHSARVEAGTAWLASELRFARYLGQHFLFVPAGRLTWASGLRFGSVGIGDDQGESLESILVRFSTGGGTSVRGYRQDALTPEIIEGFPRGGDVLVVLNQEARLRVTPWLGVVGFVDAGNAFTRWREVSWSGLEVGLGAGLRLTTPVGVVRLDVGFPRPRPANHPSALWYFSFGQAF